jgi:hypothetical protein
VQGTNVVKEFVHFYFLFFDKCVHKIKQKVIVLVGNKCVQEKIKIKIVELALMIVLVLDKWNWVFKNDWIWNLFIF